MIARIRNWLYLRRYRKAVRDLERTFPFMSARNVHAMAEWIAGGPEDEQRITNILCGYPTDEEKGD